MLLDDDIERRAAAKRVNERLKLIANALNALAVATLAGACILPALSNQLTLASIPWLVFAIVLHLLGHLVLGLMRSED